MIATPQMRSLTTMSEKVVIHDFEKDYLPFGFPGFAGPAHCFLRINVFGSNVLVLCAQLKKYHSTSVTNGLESIVDQLVSTLMDERTEGGKPVLDVQARFHFIQRLITSPVELARNRHAAARRKFLERCRWFEHYPPGTGIGEDGSLSLVTFGDAGSPSWSYGSVESFSAEYPAKFFKIDADLGEWHTKAN